MPDTPAPATVPAPAASAPAASANHANPSFELNAALGIVVIQFRNESGKVQLSIPSQAQLDAYTADPSSVPSAKDPSVVA